MSYSVTAALFLFAVGIIIKFGKAYFLIAGINTMSHKQRAEYNLKKIGSLYFTIFSAMAVLIVLGHFVGKWLKLDFLEYAVITISVVIGLFVIITRINSESYKNFRSSEDEITPNE